MPPKKIRILRQDHQTRVEKNKEACKKYRSKMSEEQKAIAREKNKQSKRKNRAAKRSELEVAEAEEKKQRERELSRIRSARHRARKREEQKNINDSPQTPAKIRVSIPQSPSKFAAAIVELVDTASPNKKAALERQNIPTTSTRRLAATSVVKATAAAMESDKHVKKSLIAQLSKQPSKKEVSKMVPVGRATLHRNPHGIVGRPALTANLQQIISSFYNKQDNITVYPNKRRNKSVPLPLKVLNYSKKKLYVKFCEENPACKLSIGSFWKYKPKDIKRKRAARFLQCVCDICENISLMLSAIKKNMQLTNFPLPEVIASGDLNNLAMLTLCHGRLHMPMCLDGLCDQCGTKKVKELLRLWATDNLSDIVKWLTWTMVKADVKGKGVNRLTKVSCTNSRQELLQILLGKLKTFGRHIFIAKSQSAAYQQCLKTLGQHDCCVVVDFAENYTCLRQNEAQSAYYSRNQVTLHPMVVTTNVNDAVLRDSVCIISDDLDHDSSAVKTFMETLSVHIAITYPNINKIHVWSDGCAAQYKSKQPFKNIAGAFDSNFEITWNFFGSRHGKCSADGEAAVVKTFLSQEATSNDILLDNAGQVFEHLKSSDLHIVSGVSRRHFYFVSKLAVGSTRNKLKSSTTVAGTRRLHQIIQGHSPNSVMFRDVSCYCISFPCWHAYNSWKTHKFPVVDDHQQADSASDCSSNSDIEESSVDGEEVDGIVRYGEMVVSEGDSDEECEEGDDEDIQRRYEAIVSNREIFTIDSEEDVNEVDDLEWSDMDPDDIIY